MSQPPLEIYPDEHLAARITAYILGEASPFEAAEIESLIAKSPELKLFANRTRTLNALLKDAETTSNSPDSEWKLPTEKRAALAPILGPVPVIIPFREGRIRRASIRAVFGIAAVFIVTLFTKRFFIITDMMQPEATMQMERDSASESSEAKGSRLDDLRKSVLEESAPQIQIGGQVRTPGPQKFNEGITLGDAVASAGGATVFGASKRVKVLRDGKATTYDLSKEEFAQVELKPGDTIEMPQKNWLGGGANRSELAEKKSKLEISEKLSSKDKEVAEANPASSFGRQSSPASASERPNVEKMPPRKEKQGKSIAANIADPASVPVPEIAYAKPTVELGEGKDFGAGWGDGGGGGGNEDDKNLAMKGRSSGSAGDEYTKRTKEIPIPGIPASGETSGPITAGNRSGDAAIPRNNIDAILNNPVQDEEQEEVRYSVSESPPEPDAPMEPKRLRLAKKKQDVNFRDADRSLEAVREDSREQVAASGEITKEQTQAMARQTQELTEAEFRTLDSMKSAAATDDVYPAPQGGVDRFKADSDEITRSNPALTLDHAKAVDKARRQLYTAQENYDQGKFDDAKQAYEDTLRIDPYNKAARRGMEKIAATKSDYYRSAYDQTRAELLMHVDKKWELAVPADETDRDGRWGFDASVESDNKKAKAFNSNTIAGDSPGKGLAALEQTEADPFADERDLPEANLSFRNTREIEGAELDLLALANSERLESKPLLVAERAKEGESLDAGYAFFSKGDKTLEGELDNYSRNRSGNAYSESDLSEKITGFTGSTNFGAPIVVDGLESGLLGTTFDPKSSGANIEVIREFIYPTEFEGFINFGTPIQIQGNRKTANRAIRREVPFFPAIPDTPTDFEPKNTGITLEVSPEDILPAEVESIIIDRVPVLGDLPMIARLFKQEPVDLADLSQEIPAAQEPFSTFSLNISDASFQIARAAIEKGERPDPTSIKPEQFYNAIDYGDPAPSSREPVAAAIDQTAHPVIPGRNLVRIAVRTASTGRSAAQPLRLTLLVDQSGSMVREDRRAAMETALEQLATLLTEQDQITVIGFSRTPRLLADSLPGNQANKLPDIINQTANEGGTNLEQAINLASELALRHKLDGAQNRIVLFTDGAANLGNANPERLSEKIETLRQQGLAFDIAGIGTDDLNDNLLAELARHGNGRYYLVGENTASSLAAQLAGAFRPAAENVKIQVKLNPERVGNYKLIGFEKDRLKTEDFRNDSIDAAELAADEAGVAMYQIETLPEGSGEIGEVSVRFRDTASGEMVERTWTIAYDPTTPALDQADPKTQLATLSLLAAQKLQGGPLADAINLENFSETIAKLRQAYKADPKTQQLLNLVGALK